jgi:hypothetical protein
MMTASWNAQPQPSQILSLPRTSICCGFGQFGNARMVTIAEFVKIRSHAREKESLVG